jgi:hypothetical protein
LLIREPTMKENPASSSALTTSIVPSMNIG